MSHRKVLHDGFAPLKLKIQESTGDRLIATGEFGRCGDPTANGRVYPRNLMEREVKRLSNKLEGRALYGELDHPDDGKTLLKRVSHIITGLTIENDGRVIGTLEVLEDTENGRQLKGLVESGVALGVSSRGLGSVKKMNGKSVVQEDFRLLTYDVVADPAVATAQPDYTREEEEYGDEGEVVLAAESDDAASKEDASSEATSEDTKMDLDTFKADNPEIVSQLEEDFRSKAESQEEPASTDSLSERFQKELQSAREEIEARFADGLEQAIAEAREEERNKLAKKVSESSGEASVEKIKAIAADLVTPDQISESHKKELGALQKSISELRSETESKDLYIEELQDSLLESGMAYALLTHMPHISEEHQEHFVEMVGDLSTYNTVESLEKRADAVAEEFRRTGRYLDSSASLSKKLDEAQARVEEAEGTQESLQLRLEEYESVLLDAQDEITSLRESNEAAELELESLAEALEESEDELIAERAEVDELYELLAEADEEVEEYVDMLDEAKEAIAQREVLIEQRDDLIIKQRDAINESEKIVSDLQVRLEETELDKYRVESAIGARNPNETIRQLKEANSFEEVDNLLEGRRSNRTAKPAPVGSTSNTGADPIMEENVRDSIMSVVEGEFPKVSGIIKNGSEAGLISENEKKLESENSRPNNGLRSNGTASQKASIPGIDPATMNRILSGS